jgi:hypothetical protein
VRDLHWNPAVSESAHSVDRNYYSLDEPQLAAVRDQYALAR